MAGTAVANLADQWSQYYNLSKQGQIGQIQGVKIVPNSVWTTGTAEVDMRNRSIETMIDFGHLCAEADKANYRFDIAIVTPEQRNILANELGISALTDPNDPLQEIMIYGKRLLVRDPEPLW